MINLVLGVVSCIGAVPRLQVHRLVLKDGVQGTLQGKMPALLFPAAVQTRLTSGTVSLQLHLWRFAFHTGVQ